MSKQSISDGEGESCESNPSRIFSDLRMYFLPTGIGSSRMKLFKNQAKIRGCLIDETVCELTTHVIVEDSLDIQKICRILKWSQIPPGIKIIKSVWFSNCLKANKLIKTKDFELNGNCEKNSLDSQDASKDMKLQGSSNTCHQKKIRSSATSGGEIINQESFVCSVSSMNQSVNHNKAITDKLEVLAGMYRATNDHWHALGYEKAIIALKKYPKPVNTWEEARAINGIGDRLADKIAEIIQSGHLRKIDETCSTKKVEAVTLFMKVWGVGASTAEAFVQQGFYTLDDLKEKARLTKSQQIGLKYFDELQERMPRAEAAEIYNLVEREVRSINPMFTVVACGSYRRNRETCGDVDVLISPPHEISHVGILPKIIQKLHSSGKAKAYFSLI